MRTSTRLPIVVFTALIAAPASVHSQPAAAPRLPTLDQFIRGIVDAAPPLALSVVVVRGDSVVHLSGYGWRDQARALPVTPRSAFYIASATKSFTALTAALLAARRVVDLDEPIGTYVPEWRLPAPLDASRITLRILLSHRGGFESNPLTFRTSFTGDVPSDSLLPLVSRTARPVDSSFTYTNTAFIVAARVLERVTGESWRDLVAREVVLPLGLDRTTARAATARDWELVPGYGPGPDGFRVLPPKPDETMHAAGGMLMSAEDAGTWLRVQLNAGRAGGRQRLPAAVLRGTHVALARQDTRFESIRRTGYALGWQIGVLDGDTLYHHFGNYPGSFAHISFMPTHGVGVAVFANAEVPVFTPVPGMIARRAYDLLLDRHDRDGAYAVYADSLRPRVDRVAAASRADFARRAARPRVPPRGWLPFIGTFDGGDLGTLSIVARGDTAAELQFGTLRMPLEVFNGDTLRIELPPGRGGVTVPAVVDAAGGITALVVGGVRFIRRP